MAADDGKKQRFAPGMTFRALAASLLCITVAAIYVNHSQIVLHETYAIAESAIPVPAILAVLALTLVVGTVCALTGFRILSKQELVCVAFATMMSVPLMTQGFWMRAFGMLAAIPVNHGFDYIDAFDDSLWPHGPNLLSFANAGEESSVAGNARWEWGETEEGEYGAILSISNALPDDVSYAEFRLDGGAKAGETDFREPFLLSALVRCGNPEPETSFFVEAIFDGASKPRKLMSAMPSLQKTFMHKTGFVRHGRYGLFPARGTCGGMVMRIGLRGRGAAEIADPRFFSVAATYNVFNGRKIVDESDWERMSPEARPPFAVVRPPWRHPVRRIGFMLGGLVPFRQWARPLAIWGSYVLLLLSALFAMNVIMRRKWAESERYPMPNARIPLVLAGAAAEDEASTSPFAAIWRNRWAWAGLAIALAYGLLKGAHFYDPHFPDLYVRIPLGDYVTNPIFGRMFHIDFVFSLFICSIAVFFELNVLMSVIAGYWLCRTEFFIGHAAGADTYGGFPWFEEQALGAYFGYFAIVVALSSRYLLDVLKDAWRGRSGAETDPLSPRAAVALFLACNIGVALWARLTGTSVAAMSAMFAFLSVCGFVASKYRVECGNPFGYFVPYNLMLFVAALGGARVFGARGMLVSLLLTGFLTTAVFFLIPGMQFELIEAGRRLRIKPRHLIYTCIVGIIGGLAIGGIVFISNGYAAGASNLRGSGYYTNFNWFVSKIRAPLSLATLQWQGAEAVGPITPWSRGAMVFGGSAMAVLTILRQYFAGFWFHPIGFMIGFTNQNDGANWGTLLVACAIRWAVLKIGGARAVRGKLLPFFAGAFAGCVLAIGFWTLANGYAVSRGLPRFYPLIP